jgi:hypothetical protein
MQRRKQVRDVLRQQQVRFLYLPSQIIHLTLPPTTLTTPHLDRFDTCSCSCAPAPDFRKSRKAGTICAHTV